MGLDFSKEGELMAVQKKLMMAVQKKLMMTEKAMMMEKQMMMFKQKQMMMNKQKAMMMSSPDTLCGLATQHAKRSGNLLNVAMTTHELSFLNFKAAISARDQQEETMSEPSDFSEFHLVCEGADQSTNQSKGFAAMTGCGSSFVSCSSR